MTDLKDTVEELLKNLNVSIQALRLSVEALDKAMDASRDKKPKLELVKKNDGQQENT